MLLLRETCRTVGGIGERNARVALLGFRHRLPSFMQRASPMHAVAATDEVASQRAFSLTHADGGQSHLRFVYPSVEALRLSSSVARGKVCSTAVVRLAVASDKEQHIAKFACRIGRAVKFE